jgi:hypothetical protein
MILKLVIIKSYFGLRGSRVSFVNTALENPVVTNLSFADGEKFNTGTMPNSQYLLNLEQVSI